LTDRVIDYIYLILLVSNQQAAGDALYGSGARVSSLSPKTGKKVTEKTVKGHPPSRRRRFAIYCRKNRLREKVLYSIWGNQKMALWLKPAFFGTKKVIKSPAGKRLDVNPVIR
jgi:hypothetical protein